MSLVTPTVSRLATPTEADFEQVHRATAVEREWYQDYPRYQTDEDVVLAIGAGALELVSADSNLKPLPRLENPDKADNWCYLGGHANMTLQNVGKDWRREMDERWLDRYGLLRLPVTSLVRTVKRQRQIIAEGALAVEESSHCAAAAFDIDASSYYRIFPDGRRESIHHPGRSAAKLDRIAQELGAEASFTPVHRPELYDARVTDALLVVAERYHDSGQLNRVIEYEGTHNQCLHLAVRPA